MYIFGAGERVRFDADEEGCIWIRHGSNTIALVLTAAQREALAAALAEAEQYAVDEYARAVTP